MGKKSRKSLSKDDGGSYRKKRRLQRQSDWRIAAALLDLAKNTAWHSSVCLTSLQIKKTKGRWLVMVKGLRGKRPVVAYFSSGHFAEALTEAVTSFDYGSPYWKDDDYPIRDTE